MAPATIVVLDPGAEPRQVLRVEPALHVQERVEVTFKLRVRDRFTNTTLDSGERDIDMPSLKLTGVLEATGRDAIGTAVRLTIEQADLLDDVTDPALRARLAPLVVSLRGRTLGWRIAADGDFVLAEASEDKSEEALQLARLREAMGEAVARFPATPVGVGASWRVASRARAAGVTWDRTTTYTLRGLASGKATVEVSSVARAGSQPVQVEPNASTRLASGSTSVHAQLTIPLYRLAASASTQESSELEVFVVQGHLRISHTLTAETLLLIEPVPPRE